MKVIFSGNEAFARGAFEAGVKVVSSYPGTPSSEITDNIKHYKEIYCEWAANEKVALETVIGASQAGVRGMTCMKHVGLNVAADPLMTLSYTGVHGGVVVLVADDPNMFSSQNEQDSRHYARFAKAPMLEPSNCQEAKDFIKIAFDISEQFCTPVLVRSCTRLSHGAGVVELKDRVELPSKGLEIDIPKWVMVPANGRGRHKFVEERLIKLQELSNNIDLNREELKSTSIGIVCSGIVSQYVQEALPDASIFKLGMIWPLPIEKIKVFAKKVKKLYVVEELDNFIETELLAAGIKLQKLNRSPLGELSVDIVKKLFNKKLPSTKTIENLPGRPPSMCAGCSHRGIFYALSKLKLYVSGDIGCYTLGLLPPLSAIHSTVCMGASVSMAHGIDKGSDGELAKKSVAVIGDSTFLHTGINGLINSFYNKGKSTVIILDNTTTGMTGHQPNPATGLSIRQEPAPKIDIAKFCEGMGIKRVRVVDPFDIDECLRVIKEEVEADELSVIVTNKPCIFVDRTVIASPFFIEKDKCTGCKACTKIGCPAISWLKNERKALIDEAICTGCELCVKVCRFGAINQRGQ
ncbi:MAG: indolepyruvate ferredoxin oxidoreductase subunit alpha [Calditerrivibrio sp.]|nr:indolepyruvate ferredoxin oxidoreductase subunit alpha [Calditerrivibrio sp.]